MDRAEVLHRIRGEFGAPNPYKEIWVETADGQSMVALVNGKTGWLMYLRHQDGDPGFSSRNPDYAGPRDAMQDYILSNGQGDEYPLAWTLPIEELQRVMEHFVLEEEPAPWIHWHNDSEDGVQIGAAAG
jgi:hypothetical protein